MFDWIPNWWPIGVTILGAQAWLLGVLYSMKADIAAIKSAQVVEATKNEARFKAIEIEVGTKVNADQARAVAHQYQMDREQMRAQIMREIEERDSK